MQIKTAETFFSSLLPLFPLLCAVALSHLQASTSVFPLLPFAKHLTPPLLISTRAIVSIFYKNAKTIRKGTMGKKSVKISALPDIFTSKLFLSVPNTAKVPHLV